MGDDIVDVQPIAGSQLQSSLPAFRAPNQQLQGLDSLVQGSLLPAGDLKLGLVIRHRTVGTAPLTAKAEERR